MLGLSGLLPINQMTELHYRLTNEEWNLISDDLNKAELKVLFHLRTLDPFGDRNLDLKVVDIAESTNLQKGTVSKALKVLSHKEYINLELTAVRVRLNSKKFPTGNQFPTGNLAAPQETSSHCRKLANPVGNFQPLEPIPCADSAIPHTLSYSFKLNRPLSVEESTFQPEPEREILESSKTRTHEDEQLLNWIELQNKNAIEPRAYAIACLNNDRLYWQEKYDQFQEVKAQTKNVPLPPDVCQVENSCAAAIAAGDRLWVQMRLHGLWLAGFIELVVDIVRRNAWGLVVNFDGVAIV